MAADGSVVIEILGDAKDITSKLQGVASGAVSGLKTAFTAVTAAVGASTAAVGAFAKSSVDVGMSFDKSMSQVAATMGKTTDEIQDLRDFAMEMGATTAFSATQAADALNYMALAGYDSEKSMEMLPNVLNLAAAGGIELATASDMVTDAASALGLSMDETADLVDKMAQASSKSNTSVAQLGDAILTVGGTAKNLAGGTTELSTALGILADNGVKGAEGGTALRNIILSLSAPTDSAAKAMSKLGVNAYDADGNLRPLNETFSDLNAALSTMTQGEQTQVLNTLFNKVDLKSVNALLANTVSGMDDIGASLEKSGVDWEKYSDKAWAAGGSLDTLVEELKYNISEIGTSAEDLQEYLQFEYELDAEDAKAVIESLGSRWDELSGYIDNARGAAEQMAQTQLDNLAGDVTMFKSALEGVQLLIAGDLSGGLREFVQMGTEGLTKMSDAFKADGISGAIGALVDTLGELAGKAAEQVPSLVEAGAQLLSGLVDGMLSALPELAAQIPSTISEMANYVTSALPAFVTKGSEIVVSLLDGLTQSLPEIGASLVSAFSEIGASLSAGFAALGPDIMASGMQLLSMLVDGLAQGIPEIAAQLPDMLSGLGEAISSGLDALTDVGIVMVTTLADGFVSSIPDLISAGLDALTSISKSLLSNAGKLVDAGIKIAKNIADGLIKSIPTIVQKVPTIVSNIANIINQNAPKLLVAGAELIGQLAIGLIQAIPTIISSMPQIISAIVDVIQAFQWLNLGKTIIDGLVSGIKSMISSVTSAGSNILSSITSALQSLPSKLLSIGENGISGLVNGIKSMVSSIPGAISNIASKITGCFANLPSEMLKIGKNLIQGLWNGISDMTGWIGQKIKGFGDGILNDLKKFFGIKSPSRLMRDEVGQYIGEGIAVGIEDSAYVAAKTAQEAGKSIANGIAAGIDNSAYMALDSAQEMIQATKDRLNGLVSSGRIGMNKYYDELEKFANSNLVFSGAEQLYEQLAEEIAKGRESFQKSEQDILAAYKSQTSGTVGTVEKKVLTAESLTKTLKEQVKTTEQFYKNLDALEARGVPEQLVDDIKNMGTSAVDELAVMVKMSDEELERYVELYNKKIHFDNLTDANARLFDSLQSELEKNVQNQNLTLQEQYTGWKNIQNQFEADSKEYIEAEKQLEKLRGQIQDDYYNKVKITLENITSLEDNYQKKLDGRISEIEKSYGLFSQVSERENVSGSALTKNLEDQITTLNEFYENLDKLAERGAPQELVEQIRDMGVDSVDELAALVSMSDEELDAYVQLYQKKHAIAVKQATKELEPLRAETDAKIQEQLDSVRELYDQNVSTVGEAFTGGLEDSIRDGLDDVAQAAKDVVKASIEAAWAEASAKSKVSSGIISQLQSAVKASAANLSANLTVASNSAREASAARTQTNAAQYAAANAYARNAAGGNQELAFVVDGQKLATVMLPHNRAVEAANPVVKDDGR